MSNNSSKITGRSLIRAGWSTLSADRELLALPIIGGILSVFAALPFILIYALIPSEAGLMQWIPILSMLFVYTFIIVLFAVALAAGASERMNGGDPNIKSSLSYAWSRRSTILQWALLTTTLSVLLRLIEQRFSIAGKLFSALGSLSWAIASYFVIPVIAVETGSGIDALRSSARVIEKRWGKALRFNLRVTLYQLVILLITLAITATAFASLETSTALANLLGLTAVLFFLFSIFLLGAVSAVARVALYRYAVGLPVPGFDPSVLERAVKSA